MPDTSAPTIGPDSGFTLQGTRFATADRRILGPLDLSLPPGGLTAIIGPNGSGKSTLLKLLARQQPGGTGLALDGVPLARWSDRAFARRVGYLPQFPARAEGFRLRELVALGRHPWTGSFRAPDARGRACIARALELTGLTALADRDVGALSGGERQRGWIAVLIAQEAPLLLLDEPTSALDINHQIALMGLVKRLGRTTIAVLHDVNLAARYCDRIIALKEGLVAHDGPPAAVMTPAILQDIYQQPMLVSPHPLTGTPHAIPA